MKFPVWGLPHVPKVFKHTLQDSYAVRDTPRYDITSVVVYGHEPDGHVTKVKDFVFPAIQMRDGDRLELKITLDAHHGIADLTEMNEEQNNEPLVGDSELNKAIERWADYFEASN